MRSAGSGRQRADRGSVQEKFDHALELLQERLHTVQAMLGAEAPGEAEGLALGLAKQERKSRRGPASVADVALVGESAAMCIVYQAIRRVSHSQATVLLRGESGTGKELVARALHYNSSRRDRPFIA
ncbi:MAG: hypothetical protein C4293_16445, partial [Nitrospiraceae bacterium]